jgi:hypothetical protein
MGKVETGERLTQQVNRYIEDLQDELAQGHTERFLETLNFYSRFWKYSWGNSVLIASQCPHATLVAGYNRWKELGFQVKKGATGIAIRAPWLRKEINPDTGLKEERLIGFFGTYVFDITQTEEWPEKQPPPVFQDPPGDYDELYAQLSRQVIAQGVTLDELPLPTGHHGFCQLGINRIVISSKISAYQKATCLIHEYCHHIAHAPTKERSRFLETEREWQAESVSYVVCKAIGVENINSRDYLLGYKLTTDKLGDMLQFIQKTTKQVLSDLDLLQPIKAREEAKEALAAD